MRELLHSAIRSLGPNCAASVGVDVEEVARWRVDGIRLDPLFSEAELAHASEDADPPQVLAGTWCAKEAAYKALSEHSEAVSLREITVGRDPSGAPYVMVRGRRSPIQVSIAHSPNYAVAVAMLAPRGGQLPGGQMNSSALTASNVAARVGGVVRGDDVPVTGVAPLSEPRRGALSFAVDPARTTGELETALAEGMVMLVPTGTPDSAGTTIAVENPRSAFAVALREFFAPSVEPGVHPTAIVDPSAIIAPTAHVGAFAVIGSDVVVGERTEIRHHVVISRGVRIGAECLIKSHAVIGEEGLGIEIDSAGNNIRIPHVGSVVIGDCVEVGSFATVCAGTITPTRIGDFSKIDDHVHVAHNVQMGRNVIAAGHAEIAGSVRVGDRAWFGPSSAVINGLNVGDGAMVGIGAVVIRSIPDGETWFGNPARRTPQASPEVQ